MLFALLCSGTQWYMPVRSVHTDMLTRQGFDFSKYKQELVPVHNTLKRLVDQGRPLPSLTVKVRSLGTKWVDPIQHRVLSQDPAKIAVRRKHMVMRRRRRAAVEGEQSYSLCTAVESQTFAAMLSLAALIGKGSCYRVARRSCKTVTGRVCTHSVGSTPSLSAKLYYRAFLLLRGLFQYGDLHFGAHAWFVAGLAWNPNVVHLSHWKPGTMTLP